MQLYNTVVSILTEVEVSVLQMIGKLAPVLLAPFLGYDFTKKKDKWNGDVRVLQKL